MVHLVRILVMVHMWSALLAGTKLGSKVGLEHWKMMVINQPFCSALLHWDSYSKPHVVLYRGQVAKFQEFMDEAHQ